MGVTIHYKGRIRNLDLVEPLIAEMIDICNINKWQYTLFTPPSKELPEHIVKMIKHFKIPIPRLRGISFRIHEDSPIDLVFNQYGILRQPLSFLSLEKSGAMKYHWNAADTQAAGADAHIQLINLLVYLQKKYFKTLEIRDEGGYYPEQDRAILEERFAFINNTMGTIRDLMDNIELKGAPSEVAEQLQDALSRSLKGVKVNVVSISAEDAVNSMLQFLKRLKENMNNEEDDDNDDANEDMD